MFSGEDTNKWLDNEYDIYLGLLKERDEKIKALRNLEEQIASWFACDVLAYKEQLAKSNNPSSGGGESKTTEPIVRPNLNGYWEEREALKKALRKLETMCASKEFFLQKGKKLKEKNMIVALALLSASEAEKVQQMYDDRVMEEFTKEVNDMVIGQKLVNIKYSIIIYYNRII
ncbi:hypothetical protein RFI_18697 [Reticulomyxa filosa]|uniref:Uncharacterized protein n=1 Tax=Reticulomyxa filosa TaxID=46433 RepID=X6MZS7_RETFI|nr:hypothetical protein RFI_18697 [Reticulomyxa filosa]|eukprot:ETO18570.1 hypothetical protein RFI_18697 [Reticulomyxa filosa]